MICIIGAGPIGSYLSYLLAKKGENVKLFEEHSEIGVPVRCSATFTNALFDILPLRRDIIVNKIRKIKLFSPNNDFLDIRLKKENIILDRREFDKYLTNKAVDEGVELFLGHKLLDIKKNELVFKNKKFKADLVVGADGPLSQVAKSAGLSDNGVFLQGMQARVKANFDREVAHTYLGLGEFSWVIPESETIARVGVICKHNPKQHFREIYDKVKGKKGILEYQNGLIPLHNPEMKINKKNIFLIGDAATMVKPTTYGGIVPGLLAAKILANNFYTYEKEYKKKIGKDLRLGLLIRKTLNKFSDKDYNSLIDLFKQEKLKEILENYERDFPSKFLFKLFLREPKLLKFGFRH